MKIVKNIMGALLRGALVLAPGAVLLWWLWGKVASFVAIQASFGLEMLWAIVITFILAVIEDCHERRKKLEAKKADALSRLEEPAPVEA